MTEYLDDLRIQLARDVGRYWGQYSATNGTTTTLVDTVGLARWVETDALKNSYVLITAANGSAPEGESRRIQAFNYTTKTITVSVPFTSAPETGDGYEIYLAPVPLDVWRDCINLAINDAWPDVWEPTIEEITPTGATNYSLAATAEDVLKVEVVPAGTLAGRPGQIMPRHMWTVQGPVGTKKLYLLQPIKSTATDLKIRVLYQKRYAQLILDSDGTDLDEGYILAGARANWYQVMADAARGQAEQSAYLQLMSHWQQVARERAQALAQQLRGLAGETGGKKK